MRVNSLAQKHSQKEICDVFLFMFLFMVLFVFPRIRNNYDNFLQQEKHFQWVLQLLLFFKTKQSKKKIIQWMDFLLSWKNNEKK